MNKIIIWLRRRIKEHYLAILVAVLVGLIYVAPNIIFIFSLGDKYQGIPIIGTSDEDFYLARIQEIIDGHPAVGSAVFWEYKDRPAICPPLGEFFYAWPSRLFKVSPVNILIASRFILPLILFLLIYCLIRRLTDNLNFWAKINAVAGGLFVLLGYDLIDYRTVWGILTGLNSPNSFLLWARPVNPIMGGIFLFAFLLCLLAVRQRNKRQKTAIIGAAFFLALMFGNYFFSWGLALAIWFILLLIYLIKREYQLIKKLLLIFLGGLTLSSPYWYAAWQASRNFLYNESALRNGLFLTHYPLINLLMLAVLAVYTLAIAWQIFKRLKFNNGWAASLKAELKKIPDWQWFCLAFIFGSLVAYSQQIITGLTIWPYHFVQYTIPLAIISLIVLFYNLVREKLLKIWRLGTFFLIVILLVWGILSQISAYNVLYSDYKNLQSSGPIFDWLNGQAKDSVVLVANDEAGRDTFVRLIPALTHSNMYVSPWVFSIMPEERRWHNYMVYLRLKGVASGGIEKYLNDNGGEAKGNLFSNWQGLYGVKQFPDFTDKLLPERIKKFPPSYRQFMAVNFREALNKYRLDYIVSVGPLSENIQTDLPGLTKVFEHNHVLIYKF